MNKYLKIALFGFLLWLVPFLTGFLFVDMEGNFTVDEIFFKSIMIIVGSFTSVVLAINYFKDVKKDYVKEGTVVGVIWLIINLGIDLFFVSSGFFQMTVVEYFTDIGIRYLAIPIYTIGIGFILKNRK
ncbi:hypothetical protein KKE92_02365 [Candidatus Micrarchaeota archaeon]|nr:hypothetical protein [Candidatus Micrarchaeota archaeon]MBU1681587.1 hypothetical protein [Candidatus Micrarchaeota archaeon]